MKAIKSKQVNRKQDSNDCEKRCEKQHCRKTIYFSGKL